MRIDYSEPKKSYSSQQPSQSRPRKEASGVGLIALFVTAIIFLSIGFGSGWMLSQRAAKKGFQAAMEQQSLENSTRQEVVQMPVQPKAVAEPQPAAAQLPKAAPGETALSVDVNVAQPLSFYKTLPSGQKNTALGSGINSKDDKSAKQPLQAVIPGNLNRPVTSSAETGPQKTSVPTPAAKQGARAEGGRFAVQAASYSLKSEAEALRNNLAAKGYSVGIVESNLGDKGTWYRVRVGKQIDQEVAKELAKKLGKGAIVIPDTE